MTPRTIKHLMLTKKAPKINHKYLEKNKSTLMFANRTMKQEDKPYVLAQYINQNQSSNAQSVAQASLN